jgi:hypothetical protein
LLIVLAFANPFIRRHSDEKDALLLIVLDNSFSMRAGNHFAEAKQQALDTLASKPGTQRAQIIALGGRVEVLTQPISDSPQLRNAIDSVKVGDGHASFAELSRSAHALSESWAGPIELHLFSDMQRTAMPDNFAEAVLPSNVHAILHNVSPNVRTPNWTIESFTGPTEITDPKNPATSRIQAIIAGLSTVDTDKTISLVINGKTISTKTARIPANGRTPVEFTPIDVNYGFNRCEIKIQGDDTLPADDTARFVVRRVDPQRVLFVHNAADRRSPIYFSAALNAATHGSFILQPMVTEQINEIDPRKFAFTVLSDTTALPSIFEHTLEQYVSKGGNILIALGLDAKRRPHIPLWTGSLRQSRNFGSATPASIGQVDFTFPALEQEKPGRDNGGWGVAKIFYAASVDPSGARTAAQLSDGTPFLLEKRFGEGHVVLFTSGLDNLTNDLPLYPVFVSFVDKTARYLSGEGQLSGSRIVDSFLQLRSSAPGSQDTSGAEVIDPDGDRPLSLNEARTTSSFRLTRAGFYQIRFSNGRDAVIGVNADSKESDLTPMSPEMLSLWTGSNNGAPKTQTTTASDAKYQNTSLWWYVMLTALVVAIAETLLSGRYLRIQREEI